MWASKLCKDRYFLGALGFVAGSTVGLISGWQLAKKKVGDQAREVIDREILETRRFYAKLNETTKSENDPADIVIKKIFKEHNEYTSMPVPVKETLGTYGADNFPGHPVEPEVEESITSSVFDSENDHDATDVPDPEDKEVPYLVRVEDFLQNDLEHSQETVTFYEDDSVLADMRDKPISLKAIGDNLGNFGRGTTDSRIMYIRNERLGVDFEVIQHSGNYSRVVLGLGEPVPPRRKPRKMPRDGD